MHIESIEIVSFRGFKHEKVYLDNYTCFVGPNGAGKSTVLNALNVFFCQNNDSKTDLASLVDTLRIAKPDAQVKTDELAQVVG